MVEAEVYRGDELLMQRTFYGNDVTLEHVMHQIESYVTGEQLNVTGECMLRVRFGKAVK